MSPVSRASGLTSTSVASSSVKTVHSCWTISIAWSRSTAGKPASSTIAAAFAASTPVPASIGIFFTASGLVLATSSISTPPSTLAMHR